MAIYIGTQSTLGVKTYLPEKYVWKINKMPKFCMIFAPKNYENTGIFMPEELTRFPNLHYICPKNTPILHDCPHIFSGFFFWGGGTCPFSPLPPRLLRLCTWLLFMVENIALGTSVRPLHPSTHTLPLNLSCQTCE